MHSTMKRLGFGIAVLATSAAAFAHPDTTESGNHWLDHLTISQPTPEQLAPLGYEVNGPAAREVDLGSGKQHLNVVAGETVRFVQGDKQMTWRFDTLGSPTFQLSEAIPGAPQVEVHVAPNPLYIGG